MKLWLVLVLLAGIVALAVVALLLVLAVRWLNAILESRRRIERQCRPGVVSVRQIGKDPDAPKSIAAERRNGRGSVAPIALKQCRPPPEIPDARRADNNAPARMNDRVRAPAPRRNQ